MKTASSSLYFEAIICGKIWSQGPWMKGFWGWQCCCTPLIAGGLLRTLLLQNWVQKSDKIVSAVRSFFSFLTWGTPDPTISVVVQPDKCWGQGSNNLFFKLCSFQQSPSTVQDLCLFLCSWWILSASHSVLQSAPVPQNTPRSLEPKWNANVILMFPHTMWGRQDVILTAPTY